VLYLDADAEVLAWPAFFDHFSGSLGVFLRPGNLGSGIVYVRNDLIGRKYITRWLALRPRYRKTEDDQVILQRVIDENSQYGVVGLPQSYCCKFPTAESKAVIGQYQASRKVRALQLPAEKTIGLKILTVFAKVGKIATRFFRAGR